MNAKTTIRKIVFIAVWLCIGGGMLTLLLAAISDRNKGACKGYTITIDGAQHNYFIDRKDVEQLLMNASQGAITGKPVASFRLQELQQLLERNTWIESAELYFDNQQVLHVSVREKEPVARVFTTNGNSFYIDSLGRNMPLSDKLSARVPMFTNFPANKNWTAADSGLLNDVRRTANYIMTSPFWLSQVAQIDITPERQFEMVPLVGNHIVKLGDGEAMDRKFRRLLIFYQQVLSKTGFDHYKVIDVQYRGQVVVSRYAGNPKVDSIQLKKNVERLLQQSIDAANDTIVKVMPQNVRLEADSATAPDPSLDNRDGGLEKNTNPNPLKLSDASNNAAHQPASQPEVKEKKKETKPAAKTTDSRTTEKKTEKTKKPAEKEKKSPKAVMPKKPAVVSEYEGYN